MLSFSVWRAIRHVASKTFKPELTAKPWCLCTSTWRSVSLTTSWSKQSSYWTEDSLRKNGECIAVRQLSNSTETETKTRWWMEMEESSETGVQERKQLRLSGSTTLYDFKQKVLSASSWGWANNDWEEFEKTVLSEREKLSQVWEAVCMGLLYHRGFIDGGFSLMEYIRSKERSPNLATLTAFMALCGEYGGKSRQYLVFECYEEILKISSLFDGQSCKCLIVGLCGTDRWREAIPYLEMARLSQNPSVWHYSPIAQAAFKNGDINTGLEIITEMGDNSLVPQDKAFFAFIEACASDQKELTFQTLFEYLKKYSWFPSTDIMKVLIRACRRSSQGRDWRFTFTKVENRGVCKACGHQARQADLSGEQFQELQENFLSKAVIGKDIFLKTSPVEMQAFLDFIEGAAPCDVVLDALNIAFRQRGQLSSKQKMEMVHSVVDYFWRKDRRVMVLGRKHMRGWSPREMAAMQKKAHCFFAENISQDDPFLLYASLSSGQNTVFVSNDEMRDHKHLLGPRVGAIFKQWQRSRQIYFLGLDYKTKRLRFQMPKAYDTLAQEDDEGWHIPYENQADRTSFQHPNSWLCIRQQR